MKNSKNLKPKQPVQKESNKPAQAQTPQKPGLPQRPGQPMPNKKPGQK